MIDPQLKLALVCFTATITLGLAWNVIVSLARRLRR